MARRPLEGSCISLETTTGTEQHYSATELETQALVSTITHFTYCLYGRQFYGSQATGPANYVRQAQPQTEEIGVHWLVTIEYLPGAKNTMADALSQEYPGKKI